MGWVRAEAGRSVKKQSSERTLWLGSMQWGWKWRQMDMRGDI